MARKRLPMRKAGKMPNFPSMRSSAVSGGSCLFACRASRLRNGLALLPEAGSAFHERIMLLRLLQRRQQGRSNLLEAMTRPCICAKPCSACLVSSLERDQDCNARHMDAEAGGSRIVRNGIAHPDRFLGSGNLSIEDASSDLGASVRQLQGAFAMIATTPSSCLLQERPEHAFRLSLNEALLRSSFDCQLRPSLGS